MTGALHRIGLVGAGVVACLGSTPLFPLQAAEITVNGAVGTRVGATDNADPGSDDRRSAGILTLDGNLGLRAEGDRAAFALDYGAGVDRTFDGEADTGWRNDLLGVGHAELWPELFHVDGQAQVSNRLRQTGAALSADPALESDERTTVSLFQVSPYLTPTFGSSAEGEARYRYRKAFTGDDAIGDPHAHMGRLALRTGPAFSRPAAAAVLEAETIGGDGHRSASATDSPADASLDRWSGEVRLQYPLSRSVFALASGGYERITADSLVEDINGPIGSVGLRFAPSPRTTAEISGGWRYDRWAWDAALRFEATPNISVILDYADYLGTVFDNLDAVPLAVDPTTGDLIDRLTGRGAHFFSADLGLSSDVYRGHRLRLSVTGDYDIQSLRLTGSWERRDYDLAADATEWHVGLDYTRQVSPKTNASAGVAYRATGGTGEVSNSRTLLVSLGLNYEVAEKWSLDFIYGFARRFETSGARAYSQNYVGMGLVYHF